MAISVIFLLATLVSSLVLDATVRPTGRRRWQGISLQLLVMTALFGTVLAGSGSNFVAALLSIVLMALLAVTSNAKYKMLGEPLVFSDLALFAGLVRHPRFYFTAISWRQRWILAIGAPILALILAGLFVPRLAAHLAGLGLFALDIAAMLALLRTSGLRNSALIPNLDTDLRSYGLIATLLMYWLRWRATPNPPICEAAETGGSAGIAVQNSASAEIVVVVQCESFADPVELTGERHYALPGLGRAQALAHQWGDLVVSGFGAYTMRTEYGVLFGRSEDDLGFRRYDPFLTAHGETSYALSARLQKRGYHCAFVHPHDMRFYGRDRLMPAIGFDRLIGEDAFAHLPPGDGRYIDDQTLGASIADLVDQALKPTLIYAVTMENHGPWDKDRLADSSSGLDAYLHHVRSSDQMLSGLIERLSGLRKSALLVFFGDHRPSIPGFVEPGGARHIPYVMLRFTAQGQIVAGENRRADLSPDQLHHAILNCVNPAFAPG